MLHCTLPSTPELRLLPSDPLPPPVDDVKQLEAQEARLNAVLEGLTKHKAEQPLGIARRGPEDTVAEATRPAED